MGLMLSLVFVFLTRGLSQLPAFLALHAKPVNDTAVPVLAVIGRVRTGIFAYIYLLIIFRAKNCIFHCFVL